MTFAHSRRLDAGRSRRSSVTFPWRNCRILAPTVCHRFSPSLLPSPFPSPRSSCLRLRLSLSLFVSLARFTRSHNRRAEIGDKKVNDRLQRDDWLMADRLSFSRSNFPIHRSCTRPCIDGVVSPPSLERAKKKVDIDVQYANEKVEEKEKEEEEEEEEIGETGSAFCRPRLGWPSSEAWEVKYERCRRPTAIFILPV